MQQQDHKQGRQHRYDEGKVYAACKCEFWIGRIGCVDLPFEREQVNSVFPRR